VLIDKIENKYEDEIMLKRLRPVRLQPCLTEQLRHSHGRACARGSRTAVGPWRAGSAL
jgi:hypothetical protein